MSEYCNYLIFDKLNCIENNFASCYASKLVILIDIMIDS